MGVCEVGRWLKDASGGWGSVVVVLVVMVVRRARSGRRKVGGRVERGEDDCQSTFRMLGANILATRLFCRGQWTVDSSTSGFSFVNFNLMPRRDSLTLGPALKTCVSPVTRQDDDYKKSCM